MRIVRSAAGVAAAVALCASLVSGCTEAVAPPPPPPQSEGSSMSGVPVAGDFGGSGGGTVVAKGTPEAVSKVDGSYTGQFLKDVLAKA